MMQASPTMNPRMNRVRTLTTAMIALTALFFVYWNIMIVSWMVPFVFGEGMQNGAWVDEGVVVSFGQRAIYFAMWLIVVAAAWFTFFSAFRMLATFRNGAFFTIETCRKIQSFGAGLVAVIVCDTLFSIFRLPIMSWANPADGATGNISPSFYFDSGNITIFLCGLGFFVVGWVLHEGAQMAEENQGFI